jgi:hypothetical protein
MGIGLGVVLLVLGLILVLNVVEFDLSFVDDQALGWVLLIVGVRAIILVLVMNGQRSRTKHVVENRDRDRRVDDRRYDDRRYDDGTTRYDNGYR